MYLKKRKSTQCYWILILLMILGSCNIKEQSEIQKEVLAEQKVIRISVDDLLKNYAKDSSGAKDLYMGKVLIVNGEVGVFEQFTDTINLHANDSLPWLIKWVVKRVESDINTSNILFKPSESATSLGYGITATFPREYRNELKGIKEKSLVTVKGKLEHMSRIYAQTDSTTKSRTIVGHVLSLQGCVLESKK